MIRATLTVIAIVVLSAAPRAAQPTLPLRGSDTAGLPGAPLGSWDDSPRAVQGPVEPAADTAAAPQYRGTATWYCSTVATCTRGHHPGEFIAAIDRKDSPFRIGDRVTVRAFGRAVTVRVVDTCACSGSRLIDLSRAAFRRLANPGLGVIPVSLERAGSPTTDPVPLAPATDTEKENEP